MDKLKSWVWLSELTASRSPFCAVKLLNSFGSPEEIYKAGLMGAIPAELLPTSSDSVSKTYEKAEFIISVCRDEGIEIIAGDSELYPPLLAGTDAMPPVLYLTGCAEALTAKSVSGVGSRRITAYGKKAASEIFGALSEAGLSLVSGMAFGIDAEVHKAAITHTGLTVAVLGTPINKTYPAQHGELRRLIEQKGAVISEYPPLPMGYNKSVFPKRNRIIAGMSKITAVVECAEKSGSMTTVGWALDFGREVFAVPGRIYDETSAGCNRLIATGATPLISASDILYRMGIDLPADKNKSPLHPAFEGRERQIYELLRQCPMLEEELAYKLDLPEYELLGLLGEMEIEGYIIRRYGRYEII